MSEKEARQTDVTLGLGRPRLSRGRRAIISKEPERLPGLEKPVSCKEGPRREYRKRW